MVSLDSLLGKTELKQRIQELESEKEDLEERLEKVDDRRAAAEREKQDAYEERNRLQSKVDELEDRVERAERDEATGDSADVTEVSGGSVPGLLELLTSVEAPDETLTTAYVAADEHLPHELPDRARRKLSDVDSPTGFAVYLDDYRVTDVCVLPLEPVTETRLEYGGGFDIDETLYRLPDSYLAAVVRSDGFAAGVYRDGERSRYTGQTSNVKSGHSKGGFSQKRFERLRDEQIQEHVEDSARELRGLLADEDVEAVYLLGQPDLTRQLSDEANVDPSLRQTTDARGEDESLLEDAVADLRSTRLYQL